MREQLERDDQTITIATTLALCVLGLLFVSVVGLLLAWSDVDVPSGVSWTFLLAVMAVPAAYLIRHRRT